MNRITMLLVALIASSAVQAAQLYRWVDDKGRVEWRDTPPPPSAKTVERRAVGGSVISTTDLPFSMQQAVRGFPVTLYVTNCGEGCDKARAHLLRRGVPYTEKSPQENVEAYRKLTNGGMEVPLLFVGREALKGYEAGTWDAALDNAGYPRQPLPGYQPPKPAAQTPPKPAAPEVPAAPPADPAQAAR